MILIAPTSYKGTIGAAEAAAAMGAGARDAAPGLEVVELPLSDGGPGLLDALDRGGMPPARVRVSGPLGHPTRARVLVADGRAVVESADACGLHLVPRERLDPLVTSTRGVGELLLAAAAFPGVHEIVCGLGGSATVDGGAGVARALGFRLLDARGADIPEGGAGLEVLARIQPPPPPGPALPPLLALCDVTSPLLGPNGAAPVFGPQKGADAAAVARLEAGLELLAERIRLDLGRDVSLAPGGGAAGGLAAGLVAFAGARIEPGSEWVLEMAGFDAALARARLVLTGEGVYDEQSALGKVTGEVVRRARARGVPVALLCGAIRAPLPEGVTGLTGGGAWLTPDGLAGLAGQACGRLLPS